MRNILLVIPVIVFLFGCAGQPKELHLKDTNNEMRSFVFPKGTVFGGASKDQASQLAQIFIESHNIAMKEMDEINQSTKKLEGSGQRIEGATQKILLSNQKNLETAQKALMILEELSNIQGTGEITIFYPVGSYQIKKESIEYERLINFVDFLSRESKGRKILFVSVGSASAFGDKKLNKKFADKRSEAPKEIIDKYLVNIPHEFFKVYGIGDVYSPKNVAMKEHQRYQSTRIIAVYATDQIPSLPEPVEDKESFTQKK